MRAIIAGLAAALMLAATPARADERADLAMEIGVTAAKAQEEQVRLLMPMLMKEMGADEAGLTAEEKKQLAEGMEKTVNEAMVAMLSTSLADPSRFELAELRQIKAFMGTSAGVKWTNVASSLDTKDPAVMQTVLASMFKNIDMKIFAKLAVAANAKKHNP